MGTLAGKCFVCKELKPGIMHNQVCQQCKDKELDYKYTQFVNKQSKIVNAYTWYWELAVKYG